MTSLNYDIKDKLSRITVFEKIIGANLVIYILGWIIWKSQDYARYDSLSWLSLPKEFSEFIVKPWSIFTYGFAHFGFWHLVFNMMILYFVGRSFSNLFRVKMSLNIYFLGILTGGLAFLLVFALMPKGILEFAGPLVGASAGVHACLIFLSSYMPDYEIRLVRINIKLKYIAIALVAFDILGLFGDNPGGNVAHLGGDVLGFYYATRLKAGKDIGKGFEAIMDRISNLFKSSKKSNLKTVHRKKKKHYAGHTKDEFDEFNKQKQIDLILDKISKSGYDSLSQAEKEFLFKAGKK
ncbi:MAG: rhomboid family intramembrane serine protease [Bacteroidia bacterium]|nr:rhomboid family intramembrane serine protease [Bacteroidia bacterium]